MKFLNINLYIIILYIILMFQKIFYFRNLEKKKFKTFSNVINKVLPSVVSIYTKGYKNNNYFENEYKTYFGNVFCENHKKKYFEGLGSGIIINNKKGYILTNNHVINNTFNIKIKLYNGKEFNAKLLGKCEKYDISLLKIDNYIKNDNFKNIKFSNSDKIKIGDFVIAIGNPFGLNNTATLGIISSINRKNLNIFGNNNKILFIQTDASINKGNSGGALINIEGELIGMNTSILSPNGNNIGIGFAIPSNIIKKNINKIIKTIKS